jgi:hypothetical protein
MTGRSVVMGALSVDRVGARDWLRRCLCLGLLLVLAALSACGPKVDYAGELRRRESRALRVPSSDAAVLDGTRELDQKALADLAFNRAHLGGQWLANVLRDDGSFFYQYFPNSDRYDRRGYNVIRHAGVTYSLYQVYDASRDTKILDAAERAVDYIQNKSVDVPSHGRAYVHEGVSKLGGQALALVALLERRRVTGNNDLDELIRGLADFLLFMETKNEPGRFFMSYSPNLDKRSLDPPSDYYPGEALLALTRLAQQFPDKRYLDAAGRAGRYLVHVRDGDIPARGEVPRDDHWLTIALSELFRLTGQKDFQQVAYLQADRMIAKQIKDERPYPRRVGAPSDRTPINYTSSATKAEALVAAWSLARFARDSGAEVRFSHGAMRNCQFQLRAQFTKDKSERFPNPYRVVGAWGQDGLRSKVRIDFVQHNISALIGMWAMVQKGDLPVAKQP